MGSPAITLRCDCGAEGKAAYGEVWKCAKCGRSYDTSKIPADDYDAVAALDRRYRRGSQALMVVLALIVLAVAIEGQTISIFAGLAVVLAFSQLPYSRRRAAGYYTGTGGNQDEAVRQFRRWASCALARRPHHEFHIPGRRQMRRGRNLNQPLRHQAASVQGHAQSGEGGGGFQCCWTNVHVKVVVKER